MGVLIVAVLVVAGMAVIVFWRPHPGVSWRRRAPIQSESDELNLDRPLSASMLVKSLDDAMYRATIGQIGVNGEPAPPDGIVVTLHQTDWELIKDVYKDVSESLVSSLCRRAVKKGVHIRPEVFGLEFVVATEAEPGEPTIEPVYGGLDTAVPTVGASHERGSGSPTFYRDGPTEAYDDEVPSTENLDEFHRKTDAVAYLEPYDPKDLEPIQLSGAHPQTLGRGSHADLLVTHPEGRRWISKVHCEIGYDEDRHAWWVKDRDSLNSTLVNDEVVVDQDLRDGDILGLGSSIRFLFRFNSS